MPRRKITFRQIVFRSLITFLIISGIIAIVLYGQFKATANAYRLEISVNDKAVATQVASQITRELSFMVADIKLASELPGMRNYLNNPTPETFHDMQTLLLAFVTCRTPYDNIRYLTNEGLELAKANDNNNRPYLSPLSGLQDKSNRPYYKITNALPPSTVYISPLDLNTEYGKVQEPHKPTIRYAIPLFNQYGIRKGILVVNHNSAKMLERLNNKVGTDSILSLIDENGFYLHNERNPEKEFSFMFPEKAQYNFKSDFPKEWEFIQSTGTGQVQTDNGLLTYVRIHPGSDTYSILSYDKIRIGYQPTLFLTVLHTNEQFKVEDLKAVTDETTTLILLGLMALILGVALGWSSLALERSQELLKYNALHDSLTGLPNRNLLVDRISQANLGLTRDGRKYALFMLDLDNFKEINDKFGHDAGDEALRHVAACLIASTRTTDTVSRIGGDEFVILAMGADTVEAAQHVADRILNCLSGPFVYQGQNIRVTGSLGGTVRDCYTALIDDILRDADSAMYKSKELGKNRAYIDMCPPPHH